MLGGSTFGGQHIGIADDASTTHRAKELSRVAQRRFRAKQKQTLDHLEAEVAAKTSTLRALTKEHDVLVAQARVLEQAVSTRDEQLAVLRSVQLAMQNPGCSLGCSLTSAVEPADAIR